MTKRPAFENPYQDKGLRLLWMASCVDKMKPQEVDMLLYGDDTFLGYDAALKKLRKKLAKKYGIVDEFDVRPYIKALRRVSQEME